MISLARKFRNVHYTLRSVWLPMISIRFDEEEIVEINKCQHLGPFETDNGTKGNELFNTFEAFFGEIGFVSY